MSVEFLNELVISNFFLEGEQARVQSDAPCPTVRVPFSLAAVQVRFTKRIYLSCCDRKKKSDDARKRKKFKISGKGDVYKGGKIFRRRIINKEGT